MSESVLQAKAARETLARALGTLQSDPSIPPALQSVAEPIAQAMSSLHTIEVSGLVGGGISAAHQARDHVRHALGMLQSQANTHPAVDVAMESVAGSLSSIFALIRHGETQGSGAMMPSGVVVPTAAPAMAIPAVATLNTTVLGHPTSGVPAAAPSSYGNPGGFPPPPAPPPPAVTPSAPAQVAAPPVAAAGYSPPANHLGAGHLADPFALPPGSAPAPSASRQPVAAPVAAPAPAPVPAALGDGPVFEVSLGTNSTSNFYKGLSGNDVVEHGGVFVATYNKLPAKGSHVLLHVTLPGAYEFQASATVVWTREQRGGASDSLDTVPGFGARFTNISPEGRHLVYRYVRNREPLFHDDF